MNVTELRLREHVDRLADEHPPIELDSVDYTMRAPDHLGERFGHVLDYMARVELEVDRNVLELTTMPVRKTRRRPSMSPSAPPSRISADVASR